MRSSSPGSSRSGSAAIDFFVDAATRDASTRTSASFRRGEVLLAVIDRVHEHLLDGVVVEAVRRLHAHGLLDTRPLFACMDREQAVGVDAERDLEARHPGGHRRNALQREAREAPAVRRELALALDDVDLEAGLLVFLGRVRRARRRRRGRVAREDAVDDSAADLDAERERDDVEEQHLVGVALPGEEVCLDRRAERDDLLGVDVAERRLAEHLPDVAPDRGHARRAADEDDAVELFRLQPRVLERATACSARAREQRLHELVEARARDRELRVAARRTGCRSRPRPHR